MKLKALLLGSAAAMIAVSGARAADAVIAEPEPVEYVKVCDLYGSGFHYIPGTETCLKFDGYVRVDYTYNDNDDVDSTSRWDYRVRFNIDARNETDYGTLRSQIRFQGDGNGGTNTLGFTEDTGLGVAGSVSQGDAFVGVDRALISIGGLRFGYSDAWNTTFHGYGNFNEKYDGPYAYDQAIFLDYTYAANGFEVAAGVQDSVGPSVAAGNHVNLDYYVGAGYSGSLGSIKLSYLHEDTTDEGYLKASATLNVIDGLSLKAWGLYDGEDGADSTSVVNGDYHWGIGARYQFTDTINADINYSEQDITDGGELAVGVRWQATPGLSVRPTAVFRENDNHSYSLRVYRTF